MADYSERYLKHPIHAHIKRLSELAENPKLDKAYDANGLDVGKRIRVSVAHIKRTLEINKVTPYLIPENILNNLGTYLNNSASTLNGYLKGNNSLLNQVNEHIKNALTQLCYFPIQSQKEILRGIPKIIDLLQIKQEEVLEDLKNENVSFKEQIKALTTTINQQAIKIAAQETQTENITAKFLKQFSDAQEKRIVTFDEKIKELEGDFTERQTGLETDFEDRTNNLIEVMVFKQGDSEKTANELIADMKEKKKEAEKLYKLAGKITIIGNHKRYADNARKKADIFFMTALSLMILAISIIALPILPKGFFDNNFELEILANNKNIADDASVKSVPFKWENLYKRIPFTLLFLLPAGYLARESKKYRDKEFKYRDFEIKMAAIDPYMGHIVNDPEKGVDKHKKMLDLAEGFFKLDEKEEKNDDNIIIPKDAEKFLGNLLKIAVKVHK